MKIRLLLAIWACKLGIFISRKLGKQGTSMPGQIAFKICPDILTLLSRQVKKDIILVCGTNGKTTTNNLLSAFITSCGHTVVCNTVGANMIWGVCCSFAEKASLLGKLDIDYACLEVDEASTVKVMQYVKPTTMVITNLFHDQLDRYGEIDMTVDYFRRSLSMSPETRLLLNGDDPLVCQLGESHPGDVYYVGVEETKKQAPLKTEPCFCPLCGEKLSYHYSHYGQLGDFYCTTCGYKRRMPDFSVYNVDAEKMTFTVSYKGEQADFSVSYRGFYNIYNIAIAYSAAVLTLPNKPNHEKVLQDFRPQAGRMETFMVKNRQIVLNLAKNPAGFNQALSAVLEDKREKKLLIAVNDNPSDGRDISWLWEVDFESLKKDSIQTIYVSGLRADELLLRLKYADIPAVKHLSYMDALSALIEEGEGLSYVLANYTAVFPIQAALKEMEGEGNGK